ncbi:MAG: ubiquinol-cytochrome c reductase iron-sulfur subunit [Gammaproteobacteria bacterium]|nr:ubiquinol-cytochrome c reductase iron-sulfur subunit [Gammaproteobacteria bacterium]
MSSEGVDLKKRRFLTATTAVVGAVGAGFAAVPFIASWAPSERAKALGAPEEADISQLEPGALLRVKWRGKVCWVVHRTEQNLADLPKLVDRLADPDSEVPQQPEYCKNDTRSIKPQYAVLVGICTHLGCSPTYRPEVGPADLGADWLGGFFCPCHGSFFDLAGRVYAGVPAPLNLEVPPHQYLSEDVILIGVDGGAV